MKHTDIKSLGGPGATAGVPGTGSTLFGQANQVINNLKDMIKLAQSLQGGPANATTERPANLPDDLARGDGRAIGPAAEKTKELPPGPPPDPEKAIKGLIVLALDMLDKKGHGDKTVNQVIQFAGPLTVKKIKELLTNV